MLLVYIWQKYLNIDGLGVDSASNRNEYYEHFLGVKVASG
jgi:hypothetical protein